MKTASELRSLMPRNVEDKVASVIEACEKRAKDGHSNLRTSWDYPPDEDLWVAGGYSKTADWTKAVKLLESLGYTVTYYYRESQFVDMYTLISWSK